LFQNGILVLEMDWKYRLTTAPRAGFHVLLLLSKKKKFATGCVANFLKNKNVQLASKDSAIPR
jgi:hypothetical protein